MWVWENCLRYYCKGVSCVRRRLRTLLSSDFSDSVCCWLLFHKRGNEKSLFWRRQIVCYLVEQMPDAWVQYFRKCLCHGVSRLLSGVFKNRWQFPKILVVYELFTGENLEGLCLGTVLLYQKFGSDLGHPYALNINGRPTDHSRAMGLYCGWPLFQSKGEVTVCIFPAQCVAKILSKKGRNWTSMFKWQQTHDCVRTSCSKCTGSLTDSHQGIHDLRCPWDATPLWAFPRQWSYVFSMMRPQ